MKQSNLVAGIAGMVTNVHLRKGQEIFLAYLPLAHILALQVRVCHVALSCCSTSYMLSFKTFLTHRVLLITQQNELGGACAIGTRIYPMLCGCKDYCSINAEIQAHYLCWCSEGI